MADGKRFAEFVLGAPPSGFTALAVSAGDGWLIEIRDTGDVLDVLLVSGVNLDLLAPWSDDALETLGVYRRGDWTSSAAVFGFTTSVTPAH